MNCNEKIEKSKTLIVLNYGFFASLLMRLSVLQDDEHLEQAGMPTMATDGNRIIFHSKYVDKIIIAELNFVIIHEVMHVAMGHIWRRQNRIPEIWNIACDFAVNYAINSICESYKQSKKKGFFNKDELISMPQGCLYDEKYANMCAEEIYEDLMKNAKIVKQYADGNGEGQGSKSNGKGVPQAPKNHKAWEKEQKKSDAYKQNKLSEADSAMQSAADQMKNCGIGSEFLERYLGKLTKPQKDWRTLLREFIEEEVNDYSFMPPDKRYDYGGIFLPDFNDTTEVVKDVLFFVDTSGSMSPQEISVCFSEIQGAINQFKKRLKGTLLFFDYDVKDKYYDFDDIHGDLTKVIPLGGGGTNFDAPFRFVDNNRHVFTDIKGIIILTDGECNYPDESLVKYPVLWVYTTKDNKPPFGESTTLEI